MTKKRIAVTGGSGKAGKWVIRELLTHGYDVVNLDTRHSSEAACRTILVDLTDLGQVHSALSVFNGGERMPIEAVIHFAAIPRPFEHPNDVVFRNNVMSHYNILEACANLGIRKVVAASSESSYGICFASEFFSPQYVPIDEGHPQLPEDSYGLSKVVNEAAAEAFHRRTGMQVVSLRLGNILEPEDYEGVISRMDDPYDRRRILWSYIDVRDVASACRLAVEKDGLGAACMNLAAEDTSSNIPSRELAEKYAGAGELRLPKEGRTALLGSEKAKLLLGWRQQYFLQESSEY